MHVNTFCGLIKKFILLEPANRIEYWNDCSKYILFARQRSVPTHSLGVVKKWLYRNFFGSINHAGPRPSLLPIRRLGLGPTIESTPGIPVEPKKIIKPLLRG